MQNFLFIFVSMLVSACGIGQNQMYAPSEGVDVMPSLTEVLTMGLVTDADDEEKKIAQENYESIFVMGEKDERNILEKTLNFASMGLFFLPETKEEYAERIAAEKAYKESIVSPENDDRNLVDKTFYWVTDSEVVAPETKEQRAARLQREALLAQQRAEEQRMYEIMSTPYVPENAVGDEGHLAGVVYGLSTYQEVVNELGMPIKVVKYTDGRIDATFTAEKGAFKRVPYLRTEDETVQLSFAPSGLLKFPESE